MSDIKEKTLGQLVDELFSTDHYLEFIL